MSTPILIALRRGIWRVFAHFAASCRVSRRGTETRPARGPLRLLAALPVLFLYAGCERLTTPTVPTEDVAAPGDMNAWAPCVVVHNAGGLPFATQMNAVGKLQRAGRMAWIRLDTRVDGSGLDYHLAARRLGLKTFSIITLNDLERGSWETTFDRLYATYPSDVWEIAGEISNGDPNVNPFTVTPAYYMTKFAGLYNYVRSRYPGVTLASAPTYGTGTAGASELEEFFKLGLLDMDVIVSLNVYSNPALSSYATVLDRYAARLAGKRVWITETGSTNPGNHIAWVREFYPRLINVVHPEMICWYAMWGGDGASVDNGFGLLDGVESGDTVERPLFRALVGEQ